MLHHYDHFYRFYHDISKLKDAHLNNNRDFLRNSSNVVFRIVDKTLPHLSTIFEVLRKVIDSNIIPNKLFLLAPAPNHSMSIHCTVI